MYINKRSRFKFKFGRRFLGTALALFLVSLTQEYLETSELFIGLALFLGAISVGAIYVGTSFSGFQKFILSVGFVSVVGLLASLLLWLSCNWVDLTICATRTFQATVAVYFIMPFFSLFLYLLTLFLGIFFRRNYRA